MTQKAPMQRPMTADEIRAEHEINGARRANTNLLVYALEQLKSGDERSNVEKLAAMTIEREQAIASLRHLAVSYSIDSVVEWKGSLVEIIDDIAKVLTAKPPEKSKR